MFAKLLLRRGNSLGAKPSEVQLSPVELALVNSVPGVPFRGCSVRSGLATKAAPTPSATSKAVEPSNKVTKRTIHQCSTTTFKQNNPTFTPLPMKEKGPQRNNPTFTPLPSGKRGHNRSQHHIFSVFLISSICSNMSHTSFASSIFVGFSRSQTVGNLNRRSLNLNRTL